MTTAPVKDKDDWSDLTAPINPIANAHTVGECVRYETYVYQTADRGQPGFVMSRGELMEFDRCPSRWLRGYKSDDTGATEWGQLMDGLALDSATFEARFAVRPETYTNDKGEVKPWNGNATVCKQWREGLAGRQEVKPADLIEAKAACDILLAEPQILALLNVSRKQVMVQGEYHDADTGLVIPLRGLIDLAPAHGSELGGCLADLKTCNSAAPHAWVKAVHERGYHWQAAIYLDLWNAATGETRQEFRHVLQESFQPWQTAKRSLSADYISIGRTKYITALKRYAICLKSGEWPDYDVAKNNADLVIGGWFLTQPEPWMILSA